MESRRAKVTCPCGGPMRTSRFDLALTDPGCDYERLFFGIAGSLCLTCHAFAMDREVQVILGIDAYTSFTLIESDVVLGRDLAA